MTSQAHKDSHQLDNDNYIKILLDFINQSMTSLPSPLFDHSKKFTGKDMDRLLPDQFKHIVSLIFQGKAPSDLEEALSSSGYRPVPLNSMCNLFGGFNSAVYDGQKKTFYKALRKLFPPDDDTLLPCVVFNPAGDPARTKKVLKYLTNLMLFVDPLESRFEEVMVQLHQSGLEYDELLSRLEDLKMQINNRLLKLDDWKQEIPLLEKQSTELTAEGVSLVELLEVMEIDVRNLETDFLRMQDRNRAIFQQNESVKAQILAKDSHLVTNSDVLTQEFNFEAQKLKELKELREHHGQELQVLQDEQAFFETINGRVSSVIQSFKDVVNLMEETAYHKSNSKELEGEHRERVEAFGEIKRKIKDAKAEDRISAGEGSYQSREKKDTWKHTCNQVNIWTKKLDQITKELMEMTRSAEEKSHALASKEFLAAELKKKITEDEDFVLKETADAEENANRRILEVRDQLREEFSDLLQPKP